MSERTIETSDYKGPDRRCADCPVKEVAVEKNNMYWVKLIGATLFSVLFIMLLPWAYWDLKSGVTKAADQSASLSVSVAEIKTTLEGAKEAQKATTEMLCYLRNRIDDLTESERKERK